jgi:ATP-dependent Clp protease adaptor protein ClpS
MTEKTEKQILSTEQTDQKSDLACNLILINDDIHTFDYVIDALIEICSHAPQQAEQCAMITHLKGKCQIKKGKLHELKPIRRALVHRNLKAVIQ